MAICRLCGKEVYINADENKRKRNKYIKEGIVRNRMPIKHNKVKQLEQPRFVIPIYNVSNKVYVWETT